MTSATDELRRLLDERGVEWEAAADAPDSLTTWATGSDTARWCADELINDRFDLYAYDVDEDVSGLTPEQAIDATLGRGTCHIDLVGYDEREDRFQCRSCDWSMSVRRGTWPRFNYCPNCGRRVIE